MKNFKLFFVCLTLGFLLVSCEKDSVVKRNNHAKLPLEFDFSATRDADCGMLVEGLKFASQVIAPDGRTWFFHDPGGVAKFLHNKAFKKDAVIWFYTLDSQKWLRSSDVYFSQTDQTPMGYGFGAYEKKQKNFINFEEMSLKMLRGETLLNPAIKRSLLE